MRDLATIRAGAHSEDAATVRIAIRALGRLERPELIADILPSLRHPLPEIRAESANAVAQAAQGWARKPPPKAPARGDLDVAATALAARLSVEADPNVRAVIGESLGRLPYVTADQVERAKRTLLGLLARGQSAADRLGVASGLEEVVRLDRTLSPMDADVEGALRTLADPAARGTGRAPAGRVPDPARDARVRRLALQALIDAESADDVVLRRAAGDPDAQVRRLAMRAASNSRLGSSDVAADVLRQGLADTAPMVRLEALRALPGHDLRLNACEAAIGAVRDPDPHVALAGLDQLAGCRSADAVAVLEQTVDDLSQAGSARGWHRAAHGIVALASTSPERAAALLPQFTRSRIGHLRMPPPAPPRFSRIGPRSRRSPPTPMTTCRRQPSRVSGWSPVMAPTRFISPRLPRASIRSFERRRRRSPARRRLMGRRRSTPRCIGWLPKDVTIPATRGP